MAFLHGGIVQKATGGSISTISGYTVHTFSTVGVGTFIPSTTGYVEVLVVGGGGGRGSSNFDGGGGGGSVLYQKYIPVLSGVAYTMTVGTAAALNSFGGVSSCRYNGGTITAPGGGASNTNNPLGSGGGGGLSGVAGLGANIIGYGFSGGGFPGVPGGGGGGAGGIGLVGSSGTGGIGLSYSITGVSSYYGGGGGGGTNGFSNPAPSSSNFGYGSRPNGPFGGGNGIIIIRYPS